MTENASIQDNEIVKAVAKHFPDGKWEFVQKQDEEPAIPSEPIQLTTEEQTERDEIYGAFADVFADDVQEYFSGIKRDRKAEQSEGCEGCLYFGRGTGCGYCAGR